MKPAARLFALALVLQGCSSLSLLDDPDPKVRVRGTVEVTQEAIDDLERLKPIVLALCDRVEDEDEEVRAAAVQALETLARRSTGESWDEGLQPAVPVLCAALRDPDPGARFRYANALANFWAVVVGGPHVELAVVALLESMSGQEPHVRRVCARALNEICLGAFSRPREFEPALAALRAAAADEDHEVRGQLEGAVKSVVKGLEREQGEELHERLFADESYRGVTVADAITALQEAVNVNVLCQAAAALRTFEPEAAQAAVPILIDVLDRGHWFAVTEAAETLGWIGPGARPAIPALERASKNQRLDHTARSQASQALRVIQVMENRPR